MTFANITLEIHGLATLALNPRAGCITCLTEIPNVTAARMDPTKAISSDQTVTFRATATPAVRAALLTVGRRVCRITRPVSRDDAALRTDGPGGLVAGDQVWLGSERLQVTTVGGVGDLSFLEVDRAQGGTAAVSSTMPVDQAMMSEGVPRGRGVYKGGPATLSGLRVTYRLHDANGDEVLFRGVVGSAYDSGDMIELTAKSDIERVGAYKHPAEALLYPFAEAQYEPAPSADIYLRGQLTTAATEWGWSNNSAAARNIEYALELEVGSVETELTSPYLASHGVPLSTGSASHRSILDRWGDLLGQAPQPYVSTPVYPRPWGVRAVAIFGADGSQVGWTGASAKSLGLSQDWYMFAEVEDDGAVAGYARLGINLVRARGALPSDFLGPQGVQVGKAWARNWVLRHKKNGVPQNDEAGAPYFPTTIAPGRVVVLPWASVRDQFVFQRNQGLVPGDQFAAFNPVLAVGYVINDLRKWDSPAPPVASFSEHVTMEPLRGGGYVWPVEQWADRAVKDTYFGDIRAMFAAVYAPGPEGVLRPIYLAANLFGSTSHKLDETNVRDRDHTIELTPDLTIERVTLQDLPSTIIAPRALWDEPDKPLSVSGPASITIVSAHASDEGYSGASVTIKRTPILNRSAAYALDTGILGAESVAGGAVAVARASWEKAVANYGKPHPRVTLVADRKRFRGFPGDRVDITLGNMPSPSGGLGVTDLRGVVLERGDNIERGTCEVEILLVGWLEYEQ